MKILVTAATVALLVTSHAGATNITQENGEKTRAVIEKVIEAYGGAEKLNNLKTLTITSNFSISNTICGNI